MKAENNQSLPAFLMNARTLSPNDNFDEETDSEDSSFEAAKDHVGEARRDSDNLEGLKARVETFAKLNLKEAHTSLDIQKGADLAADLSLVIDRLKEESGASEISYMFMLGKVLNVLKPLVKGQGVKFTDWVKTTFPSASLRSLQDYMKIAKIKNVESWAFLRNERLLDIADLVIRSTAEDPLKDLFLKHKLTRDQVKALKFEELRELWPKIKNGAYDDSSLNLLRKKISAFEKDLQKDLKSGKLNVGPELSSLKKLIEQFV